MWKSNLDHLIGSIICFDKEEIREAAWKARRGRITRSSVVKRKVKGGLAKYIKPLFTQSLQRSRRNGDGNRAIVCESRHWHDVIWSAIFVIHLICLGFILAVLVLNRFRISDRLNIDKYTQGFLENHKGFTEDYWPLYVVAGGIGVFIIWVLSLLLGSYANEMMKV